MRSLLLPLAAGACLLGWHAIASAQTQAPQAEPGVTTQDCQAAPAPEGDAAQNPVPPAADDNLSTQLDKCNGVLQPPKTGDTQIQETPPAEGKTPVIPPGALPEQQPPADGSAPASSPPAPAEPT